MKIILIDEDGKKSKEYDAIIPKDDILDKKIGFSPVENIVEIKIKGKLEEGKEK